MFFRLMGIWGRVTVRCCARYRCPRVLLLPHPVSSTSSSWQHPFTLIPSCTTRQYSCIRITTHRRRHRHLHPRLRDFEFWIRNLSCYDPSLHPLSCSCLPNLPPSTADIRQRYSTQLLSQIALVYVILLLIRLLAIILLPTSYRFAYLLVVQTCCDI